MIWGVKDRSPNIRPIRNISDCYKEYTGTRPSLSFKWYYFLHVRDRIPVLNGRTILNLLGQVPEQEHQDILPSGKRTSEPCNDAWLVSLLVTTWVLSLSLVRPEVNHLQTGLFPLTNLKGKWTWGMGRVTRTTSECTVRVASCWSIHRPMLTRVREFFPASTPFKLSQRFTFNGWVCFCSITLRILKLETLRREGKKVDNRSTDSWKILWHGIYM